jgi:hypothetical protein
MLHTKIIIAAIFATVSIAVAACGSTPGPGDVAEQPTDAQVPPAALTAVGHPDDRATDVKGYELSESKLQDLLDKCEENSGLPGVGDNCQGADGWMSYSLLPCKTRSPICIFVGPLVNDPSRAIMQVDDRRPGKPACSKNPSHGPCAGVIVAATVIAPVTTATQTTDPTVAPTSPPDTETTATTAPTSTGPTPTPSITWPMKTVTRSTQ